MSEIEKQIAQYELQLELGRITEEDLIEYEKLCAFENLD